MAIFSSAPHTGLPTVLLSCSSVSRGDPMQIMGISVMPYPWAMRTPISRPTSWKISGGMGAPPPDMMRNDGMIFVPGALRCSVRYA